MLPRSYAFNVSIHAYSKPLTGYKFVPQVLYLPDTDGCLECLHIILHMEVTSEMSIIYVTRRTKWYDT